jgi:superfamily II DNA/RNA helicase
MKTFAEAELLSSLKKTLKELDLTKPTDIQQRALPLLLQGKSVVGVAETGSGKTLAYALPILHSLKTLENNGKAVSVESQPRAVVVVPTRELGEQVSKVFKQFTHGTRLRVRTVLGGADKGMNKRNIEGAFEVLVATPGRLILMLDQKQLSLKDISILVFDEADQMLDQGFLTDAKRIVASCPPVRQLALFSATVSASVQSLIEDLFAGAEIIRTEGHHKLVPSLVTKNVEVVDGKRFPLLETLLAKPSEGGTLIFSNTRLQCDKVAGELERKGFKCAVYRGEMDKTERRANLKAFRDGKIDLLICTDLAARGLDVASVGRVINYHLPQEMENYIHRVGRTARAGRSGLVVNFVTERDKNLMDQLRFVRAGKEK